MAFYDYIIIGAGPAGSTFARIADRTKSILMLDGSTGTGKPCGGLLAPDAQKALAMFDLTLPKDVLVDPQIFSVRTIDLKTGRERRYQRMYINMDRDRFDKWLVSLTDKNVTVHRGRCTKLSRSEGGFTVNWRSDDGRLNTDTCSELIGADGASSIVRRTFFPRFKTRRYTAIQQWFRIDENTPNPFYSCIFDADTSDCCSWSIFKDDSIVFGGAFAPKNSRAAFEAQKKKLKRMGLDLGDPVRTEACTVLRPKGVRSICTGGEGVYLIGEAAGLISPSSLEGISSAINSAVKLESSIGKKHPHKSYSRALFPLVAKLLAKNLKCPFMYSPFLRNIVLASGIGAIRVERR